MMKDFKEMTALEIKEQGNSHFSSKKYELAIDCYGKAIVSVHTYICCDYQTIQFIIIVLNNETV